jgi:hypothetical protein
LGAGFLLSNVISIGNEDAEVKQMGLFGTNLFILVTMIIKTVTFLRFSEFAIAAAEVTSDTINPSTIVNRGSAAHKPEEKLDDPILPPDSQHSDTYHDYQFALSRRKFACAGL